MSLQPLYLLADSQLLFWKRQDRLLLEAALDGLARHTPLSAAYIAAGVPSPRLRSEVAELQDVT
jgi:cyanophycinase